MEEKNNLNHIEQSIAEIALELYNYIHETNWNLDQIRRIYVARPERRTPRIRIMHPKPKERKLVPNKGIHRYYGDC